MALREIAPLDDDDWKKLTVNVEAGPTPEQAKALDESLKTKQVPTVEF